MPTIQLPRDTRWGELGAGLTNLVGSLTQAWQDRQIQQGVSQIQNDPNIADNNKFLEVGRRFGTRGLEYQHKLLQSQELQRQMEAQAAQADLARAHARYFDAEGRLIDPKAAEIGARTKVEEARVPQVQAQTQEAQAKTVEALSQAGRARTAAELDLAKIPAEGALTQERRQSAQKHVLEAYRIQYELYSQQKARFQAGLSTYDPGEPPPAPTFGGPTIEPPPASTKAMPPAAGPGQPAANVPWTGTPAPSAASALTPAAPAAAPPAAVVLGGAPAVPVTPAAAPAAPTTAPVTPSTAAPAAGVAAPGAMTAEETAAGLNIPARLNSQMNRMLDEYRNLTPDDRIAAKQAYLDVMAGDKQPTQAKANEALKKSAATAQKNREVAPTPERAVAVADNVKNFVLASNKFMDGFERNPHTGWGSLLPIAKGLEVRGFGTGDLNLVEMSKATLQQQAAAATSEKGAFWSMGLWNVAHDMVPNVSYSPLSNIALMDLTYQKMQSMLQTRITMEGTKQFQMAPLNEAKDMLEKFRDRLHQFHSYPTLEPGADTATGKTIVTWRGNQLDAKDFRTIIKADDKYANPSAGPNQWISGATLVNEAEKQQITPQKLAARNGIDLTKKVKGD